jgi:hypothetical protein
MNLESDVTLKSPEILGLAAFLGEVLFGSGQVSNLGGSLFTIGFGYGWFTNTSENIGIELAASAGFSIPIPRIPPLGPDFLPK